MTEHEFPLTAKLVEEYNETAEKMAELKEIPFADPASFVSAGIFNQFSFFGFLTGSSLGFSP